MCNLNSLKSWLSSWGRKTETPKQDVNNPQTIAEPIIEAVEQKQEEIPIVNEYVEQEYMNVSCTSPYNGMVILLDNGHAKSTAGKRSPDSSLMEYAFNREIVNRIALKLERLGIKYHIICPEINEDIALSVRAERANSYANKYGKNKCLFISVHGNASGNGDWMNARGWSIYTTKGKTKSDDYATIFYEEAYKILPFYGMCVRKDMSDGDPDYEANYTVIYKTICPAVLTENLFYDNKLDLEFMKSESGKDKIADIHVNAIKRICNLN